MTTRRFTDPDLEIQRWQMVAATLAGALGYHTRDRDDSTADDLLNAELVKVDAWLIRHYGDPDDAA